MLQDRGLPIDVADASRGATKSEFHVRETILAFLPSLVIIVFLSRKEQ